MMTIRAILLAFANCFVLSQAYAHTKAAGFPCDVACIKAAAAAQGADALVSSAGIKYAMDVVYEDPDNDSGTACGWKHTFDPVPEFRVNPSQR